MGEVHDLEHPRILWNSIGRRGAVSASSSDPGYLATNAVTPTTFDKWRPSAMPATWELAFSAEVISAIAIDTHTIGTSGASLAIQEWNGSAWIDIVAAVTPLDDEPIAFLFRPRSLDQIRLQFFGTTAPEIAVIHCCEALECPQMVYLGAPTPIDMARVTTFDVNQSANGQYLGRSVLRSKKRNEFKLEHLPEWWVRSAFMPFVIDAAEHPYFLLERPHSTPTAISYKWEGGDILPERMGVRDFMQVTL